MSELRTDAYLGGRVQITQPTKGYRAGTDPVLLAAAVPALAGQTVLELGCGVGTALACLTHRVEGLRLVGVERSERTAQLARQNLPQAEIITADLEDLPSSLRAKTFDHVLMNPPFQSPDAPAAPDPERDEANREDTSLAAWFDVACRRAAPGGSITVVLPTWRLPDILRGLDGRAGDTTVLPLAARKGQGAARVIVQARKGRAGPLILAAPLVLHPGAHHQDDQGRFTAEVEAILRDGAPLKMSRSLDSK
ncbi:MAG: methyltransferase [Pseudomonadota bacterium]